jgi:adenosylcobinamide kinase/adenosylcobinamide-phosphate guanylyltransferase
MGTTVLIGGARSGKSALAVDIADAWGGPVTFIATAEPRDDEMAARIRQHQAERRAHWTTIEEPMELAKAVTDTPADHLIILDCLTLWIANLLDRGFEVGEVDVRARETSAASRARATPVVVITNEVGSGIVPVNPLARTFRDVLGSINSIFARDADRVLFVSAGMVTPMLRPKEVLRDVIR